MKTHKISEQELDERLELDRRRNNRAFCICFKTLEEAPDGFYDLQRKISDGLENELCANFEEGYEAPRYKWANPTNKWFCFNGDMFGSERIVIEMSKEILGDKLIGLIMSYLEKCPSRYCVIASVYENMERGSKYLGRFVINLEEIAVEESLTDVWGKQIKFMEIEDPSVAEKP
jgi:hypothetical protein